MRFVLTLVAVLAVLAISSPAAGQTLVVTKSGYYLLTQDAAGAPVLSKIPQVITLGEAPTKPPDSPDPQTPEAAHRTAIREATIAVVDTNKANTKLALSKLYQTIAGLPVTERSQLFTATDLLFNALNLPVWVPWKKTTDQSLNRFGDLDAARRGWVVVAEVLSEP